MYSGADLGLYRWKQQHIITMVVICFWCGRVMVLMYLVCLIWKDAGFSEASSVINRTMIHINYG